MTTRTILVTGAGGYIGRFVVRSLLDMGMIVTTVDTIRKVIDSRATALEVDIFADSEDLYEKLGKPNICLHMAWKNGFIHNAESHMQNLFSHYQFMKHMINGGLKHISVMGTMHEIGYYEGQIDEKTPANPHSLYGIAKNSLRQSMEVLLKDKDIVFQWLRAFYITGDDLNNKSIFTKIIQAEQDGKQLFPFTSGKNKYDFISVDDLAKQISTTIMQTEITGIINCCTGEPVSLRDMVENFIVKNKFKIKLDYGAYPDRPYDSAGIWGNNEKIQKIMKMNSKGGVE